MNTGDITKPRRPRTSKSGACAVETCDREDKSAGYCGAHYDRLRLTGDVQADVPLKEYHPRGVRCSVESCERVSRRRGYCGAHYQRWAKTGDARPDDPIRGKQPKDGGDICSIDGCESKSRKRGWCMSHYDRWKLRGDPEGLAPCVCENPIPGVATGRWPHPVGSKRINSQGYVEVLFGGGLAFEHRLAWEARHGLLLEGQNIHHRNGDRADNRVENLEVWDTSQPAGQRPEDKVAFALEMLRRYAPECLGRLPVSG